MSTYTQILYQIVFGSKDYTEFLNKENQGSLFGYIVGILMKRECHPYQIGGCGNHVHILTHVSTTITLAGLVRDIKRASHEMMVKGLDSFRTDCHYPGNFFYGFLFLDQLNEPIVIHPGLISHLLQGRNPAPGGERPLVPFIIFHNQHSLFIK